MKYAAARQQELQELTRHLLQVNQVPTAFTAARDLADDLRKVIQYHDWKYYVEAVNLISDFDYDALFRLLKQLEQQWPDLQTPDSPTQRVAKGLTEDFPTVEHSVPMLSLDNSYNSEDLLEWDKRVKGFTENQTVQYCVEPKFDGSSIALLYENNLLVRAATRGDGTMGEEITNNAKQMRSIPLQAEFNQLGAAQIELRGEVVIHKKTFAAINQKRAEEGLPLLQNPRNSAAGALRVKDPEEVRKRGLEAFIYAIGYAADAAGNNLLGTTFLSHFDNMEQLGKLGFKIPMSEKKCCNSIEEVMAFIREWEEKRDDYDYEIDGMVVKVDNLQQQQWCGSTAHHPRWAIAYKFKAREAQTTLLEVDFQVGRTGAITPVAKVDPVYIGGVTVSSISLHNSNIIEEKDIRLGDVVVVQRAGDVIPYIDRVITEKRTGKETPISFPDTCPSCRQPISRIADEAVYRCINTECPAQAEERLIHFVSKEAMNIDGMGRETVIEFYRDGFLSQIPDVFRLPYDQIVQRPGWKEKSVQKMKEGIDASKQQPLWRLLNGLGIRHVGTQTAKDLAKSVQHISDLFERSAEDLQQIDGIGEKVAGSISQFFHQAANQHLLLELEKLGVNLTQEAAEGSSSKLDGLTFLFTGSLTRFTRDQAKEMVEKNGGKLLSSVSPKLHYLVTGENAGSKLQKAKEIPSIQVIDEDTFLAML